MKKLVLGICLSFGVLHSADEFSCKFATKMMLENGEKSQKAYDLGFIPESQRYMNNVKYYIKQILINCNEKDERYKLAKELHDGYKKIEEDINAESK